MFEPKCPRCGRKCTPTGYSKILPQWRCKSCINDHEAVKERADLNKRISELENQLKEK